MKQIPPNLPNPQPPPLPTEDGNLFSAKRTALVLAGIALIILVLLAILVRKNDVESGQATNGGGPGNGSTDGGSGHFGSTQSNGDSTEGEPKDGVSGGGVLNTTDNVTTVTEAANNSNSGSATAENEPKAENKGQPSEDVLHPKSSAAELNDADSPARQFFTLGTARSESRPTVRAESTSTSEALTGRSGAAKDSLLLAGGGTEVTEAAVKLGLEWLAKNQQTNGLWSIQGPYQDGGMVENNAAATAMALLAFQGAGHTHQGPKDDPFGKCVATGSRALLKHIFESEDGGGQGGGYTQAMCTMAICELYGMTHDSKLRKPVTEMVQYCIDAQSGQGGWRYTPQQDSDTSVTGWFLMGLQSAKIAGLKIPKQTFDNASRYLDAAGNQYGSRYGYQPGVAESRSMTAEALLCRQYLGWHQNDSRLVEGVQYLCTEPPSWSQHDRDVYYWYYATQVCHHMGGNHWQTWNNAMREVLPANQVLEGEERGSWDPAGDRWGSQGGRLYVTCLSLYMLEVYYRYMPLYQTGALDSH